MSHHEADKSLLILFGLPGAGKSYVGDFLSKTFSYHFYDADNDLPEEYREWLRLGNPLTDVMRLAYYQRMFTTLRELTNFHDRIAMSQVCAKEFFRIMLLNEFPWAMFILVTAPDFVREDRLISRENHFVSTDAAIGVAKIFDRPQIPHSVLINDGSNLQRKVSDILLGTYENTSQ